MLYYHTGMSEFVLPYGVVRTAKSPDEVLLSFLQSTYEAAATHAKWDRHSLSVGRCFIDINSYLPLSLDDDRFHEGVLIREKYTGR
jgi:Family of unknown function (DUF5996)